MINIVILACLFLYSAASNAQTQTSKLDSILYYEYDSYYGKMFMTDKKLNIYNLKNQVVEYHEYEYKAGTEGRKWKISYSYDLSGRIDSFSKNFWKIDHWFPLLKEDWSFTNNGQIYIKFYYVWNQDVNKWDSIDYIEFSYDQLGNNISQKQIGFYDLGSKWGLYHEEYWNYNLNNQLTEYGIKNNTQNLGLVLISKDEYYYQSNKKVKWNRYGWGWTEQKLLLQYIDSFEYYNYDSLKKNINYSVSKSDTSNRKYFQFSYDSNHYLNKAYEFLWNTKTKFWDTTEITDYSIDPSTGLVMEIMKQYPVSKTKSEFTYNNDGKLEEVLYSDWNKDSSMWVKNERKEYTYSDGELVLYEEYGYKYGDSFPPIYMEEYYYSNYNSIEYNHEKQSMLVYPNPGQNVIYFDNNNFDELSVININGQEVLTATNFTNSLDISQLTNGTYILILKGEKGVYSQVFIKN